jgi:fructokinase
MTPSDDLPRFVSSGDILTDLIRASESSWISRAGGAGLNVARVVSRLGVPSACAGAVGNDVFSQTLWKACEAAELDMRFLQRMDGFPLLAIVHQMNPPDYFFLGENSADLKFDPTQLPRGWMDRVLWTHFGGISLVRQPLGTTLVNLAEQLSGSGVKISFDPNYRNLMKEGYEPTFWRMVKIASLIKVSDEDLRMLFPSNSEVEALELIHSINPLATLFVTRGPQEASLIVDSETFRATPPPVAAKDSVGAGDASIGAMLFSIMTRQSDWQGHLRFSLAAGAAACLHSGAHSPSLDEVDSLLTQL